MLLNRRAAVALLAGSLLVLPVAHAEDAVKTDFGSPVTLEDGTMRSLVSYREEAGAKIPQAFGVEISGTAMNSLPGGVEPVVSFLPRSAAASLTPFKFTMVDWNPGGHVPPGVYDVPHFDFHFYLTEQSSLDAIQPAAARARARAQAAETSDRGTAAVPRSLVPPGFISVGAVVPMMGDHLIDVRGPEFTGQPFTHTFIYARSTVRSPSSSR